MVWCGGSMVIVMIMVQGGIHTGESSLCLLFPVGNGFGDNERLLMSRGESEMNVSL